LTQHGLIVPIVAVRYGLVKLEGERRRVLDYVLGVGLFLLALTLCITSTWLRSHYPYLPYFVVSISACYWLGMGPANLVAALSAIAVFITFVAPGGLLFATTQTPATSAGVVLFLLLATNWVVGSLKTSRDRLSAERERYARLAESRDLLYRELQHRVSNNIQIISGLLLLQSQAVGDQKARHALSEASSRIGLIARIQRQLHAHDGERAPFHSFARELLIDAIAASGAAQVRLEIEGGEEPLHAEQATPVSLVLLECVNNALEHAFTAGGGLVRVSMAREGPRHVLTVADDGKGLPDGFDLETSGTLGLKIVRTMAGQIGGGFSMTREARGVACRLHFPAMDG
jgi:two-component sensor histidine kinase